VRSVRARTCVGVFSVRLAGGVDAVTFACDATASPKCPARCVGGVLEWSCAALCRVGACSMGLDSCGIHGTLPAAIGDLRCAGLLTDLYAPLCNATQPSATRHNEAHCVATKPNDDDPLIGAAVITVVRACVHCVRCSDVRLNDIKGTLPAALSSLTGLTNL
jgi:hypothetical protein